MKKVNVNAYQIALVFKSGVYQTFLTEGVYWLWNKQVYVYEKTQPFIPPIELNLLLQDKALSNEFEVVEVKDQEIVLHFENGVLRQVLNTGRYAFWKSVLKNEFIKADISKVTIDEKIDRSILSHRLVYPYVRSYTIENFENGVLFIDGKYEGVLQSGVYNWWKNAIPVLVGKVDKRQLQLEINGQEILTKDKANLRINAWAQYKVVDIEKAVLQNKEYDKQLYVGFQLALREYVASFSFDELLEKRERMSETILESVKDKALAMGVEVTGFGIRDIILPGDVKEIMNQVLIAEKKAQANTIMRREETASTRSLLNTAKLMEDNVMLWKLKEMEYVSAIAEKINNISVNGNGVMEQLKQVFLGKGDNR